MQITPGLALTRGGTAATRRRNRFPSSFPDRRLDKDGRHGVLPGGHVGELPGSHGNRNGTAFARSAVLAQSADQATMLTSAQLFREVTTTRVRPEQLLIYMGADAGFCNGKDRGCPREGHPAPKTQKNRRLGERPACRLQPVRFKGSPACLLGVEIHASSVA